MRRQVNWRLHLSFRVLFFFFVILATISSDYYSCASSFFWETVLDNAKRWSFWNIFLRFFPKLGRNYYISFLETKKSFQENFEKIGILSETLKCLRSSHQRCSIKNLFLKVSQYSQEKNTGAGFSF